MKKFFKVIAAMLACIFLLSTTAFAAETRNARSSAYIFNTYAEMTAGRSGKLTISFSVAGMDVMSQIGASTIKIYEDDGKSTSLVATYRYTDTGYSNMMGYNKIQYSGTVSYTGTIGYKYYAEVYLTAKDSTGSDTITEPTSTVTAKR